MLTSLIWSAIFLMSWSALGKKPYTLIWSASFAVSACQWAGVLSRSYFDSDINYWTLVTSLSMFSVLLGAWGHCIRTKVPIRFAYLISGAVIVGLAVYYFRALEPHVGLYMSLYIYYDVAMFVLSATLILRFRKQPRLAEVGAAFTYYACALGLFIAATIALMQGAEAKPEYLKLYLMVNFITVPTAQVGMAVFILFMMASDLAEKMKNVAETDVLTGCLNRRGFYEKAQKQLYEEIKELNHVCLIYWDIDKFKKVNDLYGHAAGDTVLAQAAKRVSDNIKSSDLMGRVGGEEFVILVSHTNYQNVEEVAERLRKAIAETPIIHKGEAISITASFGVVDIQNGEISIETAIDIADKALYSAKEKGRNKVARAENFA
nr:GGDEF domain-containing protein [Shewanella gelidii]